MSKRKIITIDMIDKQFKRKDFSNNKYLDTAYWIFKPQPSQDSGLSISVLRKIIFSISIGHTWSIGFTLSMWYLSIYLGPISIEVY